MRIMRDSLRGVVTGLVVLIASSTHAADAEKLLDRMWAALVPRAHLHGRFTLEIDNGQGWRGKWGGRIERVGGSEPSIRLDVDNPPDIRGIQVTVQRSRDDLDEIRVFLPSVRRVRTIYGSMRGESFLGTDFNYEDLGFEQLDARAHRIVGEDEVDGRPCDRVETIPVDNWWYSRIVRCIDREDYVPRRTEYFDEAGELLKIRTFDQVQTIDGHPTPLRLRMETVPAGTSSTITLSGVTYQDVP
jgi:hypothetical protein